MTPTSHGTHLTPSPSPAIFSLILLRSRRAELRRASAVTPYVFVCTMARLPAAVVLVLVVVAATLTGAVEGGGGGGADHVVVGLGAAAVAMRRGGRTCRRGTVGECMEYLGVDGEMEDQELAMGAAAAVGGKMRRRRLQGGSGYIGYDALRRDSVPCSQRGASYYNCQPGAEANPYSRGCSAITQCRS
ncbi:hypothetical protein GUJ93_ZPchr0008g11520 [Zizania palustris]|uniref:Rapid alkalinization factor n=1 Tax=Zizania palustris TaxID=103762 RepID=A0A8J5R7C9_ZIZPA|nr:hypothetical protein GUJ93_ZPchr0008g11520 [Zizania palustris]